MVFLGDIPPSDDIKIGETISFLVYDKMKAFRVESKGLDVKLKSLDLTMVTHVDFGTFRKQREILKSFMTESNPVDHPYNMERG